MISPGAKYDQGNEGTYRAQVDASLKGKRAAGDVYLLAGQRLILTAPNGSQWQVVVSNAGALSCVAV